MEKQIMITLYGSARSRAARCLWMLEELGEPYDHLDLDELDAAGRLAAVRPVNPIGKVPALEDGDIKLFESMAINLYLARKYSDSLWPAGEAEQAYATAWSIWGMTEMEPPLAQLFFERVVRNEDTRDTANEAKAEQDLKRPMVTLETELGKRAFLLGEQFSIADLNLASVMTLMLRTRFELDGYPNIQRWLDTCFERPAFKSSRPA
jgi:glutathione S-transferase